ncbi:outer membrane protein assembly factor BamD [Candidatus Cyrtobacter comes]|nr:outer membrane protein assembly factor BamD [Candidatus Cyrtobacter comes]
MDNPKPAFLTEYYELKQQSSTKAEKPRAHSLKKNEGNGGVNSDGVYIVKEPYSEYEEAMIVMVAGNFANAAVIFESIFLQHPSSKIAPDALLMAAFSSYKANKIPDAVAYLDDFIHLYKFNENIPYAYYLKALAYYNILPYTERDLSSVKEALILFARVVEFFPQSEYAQASKEKILFLRNILAQSEIKTGVFYLKSGDINAALPRFYTVLKNYSNTVFLPEALYRVAEVYNMLGLENLAGKYRDILNRDFEDTKWCKLLTK